MLGLIVVVRTLWIVLYNNSPLAIYLYHMKLIITESQKEKVLRNLIKNNGVKFASNMVGGIENLFDVLNIKSPMEFLNMYNDLDVVQSEEKKDWTLFRYEKYKNLCSHCS